jgi:hypothetical protein
MLLPSRRVRCRGAPAGCRRRALACFAGDVRSGRETSPGVVWLGSLSEARPARVGWVRIFTVRSRGGRRRAPERFGAARGVHVDVAVARGDGTRSLQQWQRSWSVRSRLPRFCGIWSLTLVLGSLLFHGRLRPDG